ncbi:MAG: GNAT family N-acetyltransferase [Terriglobales bacterium]
MLVLKGEEIARHGLDGRVLAAKSPASAFDGGNVVGAGGLKVPDQHYRNDVLQRAGVKPAAGPHNLEIGWLFVGEEYRRRGHGSALVAIPLEAANTMSVSATVRTANSGMKHIFYQQRFLEHGEPFGSTRGGYALSLLTYPAIGI